MRPLFLQAVALSSLPAYYILLMEDCLTYCCNFANNLLSGTADVEDSESVFRRLRQAQITVHSFEGTARRERWFAGAVNLCLQQPLAVCNSMMLLMLLVLLLPTSVRAERRNVSVPKGRNPVRNSKFDLPLSSVAETHYLNLI